MRSCALIAGDWSLDGDIEPDLAALESLLSNRPRVAETQRSSQPPWCCEADSPQAPRGLDDRLCQAERHRIIARRRRAQLPEAQHSAAR